VLLGRYKYLYLTPEPFDFSNNNIPAHDNTGERSSQYAAENSCRTRYAPFTEWIASFDVDEYLVPMGKYTSLKDVVTDAGKGGTNILSFRSTRAKLRYDFSENEGSGRAMIDNATFLDAYNCDSSSSPKPSWADRARKQIYRADYVKYHFVHYSTVTQGILETYDDSHGQWQRSFGERPPSERVTDEVNEGEFQIVKRKLFSAISRDAYLLLTPYMISQLSCCIQRQHHRNRLQTGSIDAILNSRKSGEAVMSGFRGQMERKRKGIEDTEKMEWNTTALRTTIFQISGVHGCVRHLQGGKGKCQ